MRQALVRFLKIASLGCAVGLAACGGGGGDGGTLVASSSSSGVSGSSSSSSSGGQTGWVQGQFAPESTYAAMCVTPRTGTDPGTGKAYPDRQGSILDEKNWLRSWNNDLYLWYNDVVDQDPGKFTTDAAYFDVLKTTATTASGAPVDKFHFTYPTSTWESLSQSGVQAGYGATITLIAASPPRQAVIAYVEPGSPAATAPANLARGANIVAVDGVDLINANDQASIDTLNAGLFPDAVGESHAFTVIDAGAASQRTVTLVSANITSTPVQNVKTITSPAGTLVGYMLFNDHIATAESELVAAFSQLKTAGVQDLVLDIRYNGGGYLDIASEVAFMVAGPTATAGQTFELTQFNSKHATTDPVTGAAITPTQFHSTTQGFSGASGQNLPSLNLTRVFVLTTGDTCSASEAIINGLRGVNVQVIQVGSTTCGKPYGFYPADNCGVTYFSIQFRGVNEQGFGDYTDGFTPQNTVANEGFKIPGCSVADDFSHQLGDSREGMLSAALNYQSTGACGVAPSGAAAPSLVASAGASAAAQPRTIKSLWQQNRIYRRPPRQ